MMTPVVTARDVPPGSGPTVVDLVAGLRPDHAARLALRTRSLLVREAMARTLSGGRRGDGELLDLALSGRLPERLLARRPRWLAALAMTWAGQVRTGRELRAAAATYQALWSAGSGEGLGAPHHQLAAQTLLLSGQREEAQRLLPLLTRLPEGMQPFLDADLLNPYAGTAVPDRPASPEAHRAWEDRLSAPFTACGHAPLQVRLGRGEDATDPHLFDRLCAPGVAPGTVDGPLVTVVVACYRPDEALLTSVASIAAQSYGALEVLLVDDCSGPGSDSWFERALALDGRVRLIRRPTNGGPYLVRNDALRQARGELVTFQDADDWSHPERIATQAALLGSDPSMPACHTLAVRAHDDLTHPWIGYRPVRTHASSLMVRASTAARLGDFLRVRKGADSEYAERIEAQAGAVGSTRSPLAVYRLREGSLSRSDFTYQWAAPERLAFKGTYRAWQRAGRPADFPAPLPFVRGIDQRRTAARLSTAFLADFSGDPGSGAGPTALVHDLPTGSSERTGIWHLEDPWLSGPTRREMHDRWFDRIVAEPAWQALSRTEPVHVDRLVILDPSVLVLVGDQDCSVTAGEVEVRLRRGDPSPDRAAVASTVRRWFGREPRWVELVD
jgi:O-antigen biosynthesis protein